MAEGLFQAEAVALLEDLATRALYMRLHIGPPGAAGTSNLAAEDDLVAVTWGTPALVGAAVEMTHTNDLEWPLVEGSEKYTHATFLDDDDGSGVVRLSGLITASAVVVGDNWVLPAGAYIVRWPLAS
jgi:hypothetical protein